MFFLDQCYRWNWLILTRTRKSGDLKLLNLTSSPLCSRMSNRMWNAYFGFCWRLTTERSGQEWDGELKCGLNSFFEHWRETSLSCLCQSWFRFHSTAPICFLWFTLLQINQPWLTSIYHSLWDGISSICITSGVLATILPKTSFPLFFPFSAQICIKD